jgi:IclR family transcriptional regulator, acetate operon repressor
MSNLLERAFSIFELLSKRPEGVSVSDAASELDIPPSATHRLFNELMRYGYIRQDKAHGDYALTIKLALLGLTFLNRSGIVETAQPILDQLAEETRELARLSVIDGDTLAWVARAQGARFGLRYDPDPDQGTVVHLASTATGQAWLMTMSEDEALVRAAKQGFNNEDAASSGRPPHTAAAFLEQLGSARQRGFAMAVDSFTIGTSAVAAPVRHATTGDVIAVVSLSGPTVRMTLERLTAFGRLLVEAAETLSRTSGSSSLLAKASNASRRRALDAQPS